ncbi:hypothetical protein, partial [Lysinibacillus agricola]|uniref:hypothetical protein n=1 Tax=Lysinibacillus agricola TaxID=2590012 RepID=UPI003C22C7B5
MNNKYKYKSRGQPSWTVQWSEKGMDFRPEIGIVDDKYTVGFPGRNLGKFKWKEKLDACDFWYTVV